MSREIFRTKNFVADAARFILDRAHQALGERGEFRVALSGGNTPRPVYAERMRGAGDFRWRICFLVNATKQADLIERVLAGDRQFAASRVQPTMGDVTWIIGQ